MDDAPSPSLRLRARQLASIGYGWEDICAREKIVGKSRRLVRRMVLNRTWRANPLDRIEIPQERRCTQIAYVNHRAVPLTLPKLSILKDGT
jgi:hypothetical protein